jgi:hypothetical protein
MITTGTAMPVDMRIAALGDAIAALRTDVAHGTAAADNVTRGLVANAREHRDLRSAITRLGHGQAVNAAMNEHRAAAIRTTPEPQPEASR